MLLLMPLASALPHNLYEQVSHALVLPGERQFTRHRWQHPPKIIVLYFGASWCSACHAFTPELLRVRNMLRDAGVDTEVVYVGLDERDTDVRRDMRVQRMPWPAIAPRRLRNLAALRAAAGPAPPNLLLIDRDGHTLASAWNGRRHEGMKQVLERWLELSTSNIVTRRAW